MGSDGNPIYKQIEKFTGTPGKADTSITAKTEELEFSTFLNSGTSENVLKACLFFSLPKCFLMTGV